MFLEYLNVNSEKAKHFNVECDSFILPYNYIKNNENYKKELPKSFFVESKK